jgi:hypothetical protein|tara:strand:- start:4690 stop:5172 length:483 start_codon:yes stop_codon:yes gene_type:complete
MIYRIRIILDYKEDIIRDIEIEDNSTFEDLHYTIINYFNLDGKELAAFYISNDNWEQGEEIVLDGFNENNQILMNKTNLKTIINKNQKKFIYVYDFLKLWTFFVEIFEISEGKKNSVYPKNIFSNGDLPSEAPEKQFIAQENEDSIEDKDLDYNNFDDYY